LLATDDCVLAYIQATFALFTQNGQKLLETIHGYLLPGHEHQQKAPAIFEAMKRLSSCLE
jgi:hypothetical protein